MANSISFKKRCDIIFIIMVEFLLKIFVKDYQKTKDPIVRKRYGLLGSFFGFITNIILFLGKIILGAILGLSSMMADAINNLSDFGNNFIAIFGFKMASKKPDKDHPFGHQRMEYVISLIIAMIILSLGIIMVYQGILDTIAFFKVLSSTGKPQTMSLSYVGYVTSMVVLSLAIVFKILQAYLYHSLGKRVNNLELKALSKDSLNDVIATSLVLIGLVITWFTSYSFDCFFSIFVGVFVAVSSISILKAATHLLLGQQPEKETVEELAKIILDHKDVIAIHDLTLHYYGHIKYAVIHVEVDAKKDIMESHKLVDSIEREVKSKMDINLTIHMDPILIDDPLTDEYLKRIREIISSYDPSLHFHDFRVTKEDKINISFDLVMPDEEKCSFDKEKFENNLLSSLKEDVKLYIEYDESFADSLLVSDVTSSQR